MKEGFQEFSDRLAVVLDAIKQAFPPGYMITLIARMPDDEEADFVMSADDLAEVEKLIVRRRAEKSTLTSPRKN